MYFRLRVIYWTQLNSSIIYKRLARSRQTSFWILRWSCLSIHVYQIPHIKLNICWVYEINFGNCVVCSYVKMYVKTLSAVWSRSNEVNYWWWTPENVTLNTIMQTYYTNMRIKGKHDDFRTLKRVFMVSSHSPLQYSCWIITKTFTR